MPLRPGEAYTYDGIGMLARDRLLLIIYGKDAKIERTRWLFDRAYEFAEDHERLVILLIVPDGSAPPDAPTRAENTKRLSGLQDRVDLLVTVPLGDAFFISIVRTVMRGLAILARQSKWNVVEASLSAGMARLAGQPGMPHRTQILKDLDTLCQALDIAPLGLVLPADRRAP